MSDQSENSFLRNAKREVTPAFTLNKIGEYALKKAEETERGSQLELITALLMCALSLEAVLNHVGAHLFIKEAEEPQIWDAVERVCPRKKPDAIAERCNLTLDFGARPFQDFGPMFKFRDNIVHAKTMHLIAEQVPLKMVEADGDLSEVPALQVPWECKCNVEIAKRWRESVYQMSDMLCTAAHCLDPIQIGGFSTWSW
jgi:hypothetical protein